MLLFTIYNVPSEEMVSGICVPSLIFIDNHLDINVPLIALSAGHVTFSQSDPVHLVT